MINAKSKGPGAPSGTHVLKLHAKAYICPLCGLVVASKKRLAEHWTATHSLVAAVYVGFQAVSLLQRQMISFLLEFPIYVDPRFYENSCDVFANMLAEFVHAKLNLRDGPEARLSLGDSLMYFGDATALADYFGSDLMGIHTPATRLYFIWRGEANTSMKPAAWKAFKDGNVALRVMTADYSPSQCLAFAAKWCKRTLHGKPELIKALAHPENAPDRLRL